MKRRITKKVERKVERKVSPRKAKPSSVAARWRHRAATYLARASTYSVRAKNAERALDKRTEELMLAHRALDELRLQKAEVDGKLLHVETWKDLVWARLCQDFGDDPKSDRATLGQILRKIEWHRSIFSVVVGWLLHVQEDHGSFKELISRPIKHPLGNDYGGWIYDKLVEAEELFGDRQVGPKQDDTAEVQQAIESGKPLEGGRTYVVSGELAQRLLKDQINFVQAAPAPIQTDPDADTKPYRYAIPAVDPSADPIAAQPIDGEQTKQQAGPSQVDEHY